MDSERFIHDELARRAEEGLPALYRTWKKHKKITPFVIAWPSDTVYTEKGTPIDGPCVLELPPEKDKWQGLLAEVARVVGAYGILRVAQGESDVQAIFETRHGAKCWTMPIVRSGDVNILKEPVVTEDQECLGLLWKTN
jgi:hypothetical protein